MLGAPTHISPRKTWSALHILAMEGHEEGNMVENIISHGLDVDGQEMLLTAPVKEGRSEEVGSHQHNDRDSASKYLVETPLSCALRSNAFRSATHSSPVELIPTPSTHQLVSTQSAPQPPSLAI